MSTKRDDRRTAPLRKVIGRGVDHLGDQTEHLECGHTILRKQNSFGYTTTDKRRCHKCLMASERRQS